MIFSRPRETFRATLTTPAVLFQHNVEAMIWKRHYEVQTNPLKKAYLYGQWQKMRRFEQRDVPPFRFVIAVSADDREQMKHEYGAEAVFDVPTGVDIEFFRPSGTVETANAQPRLHGFDGLAAERGRDPLLHARDHAADQEARLPDVTLTVVGRNPPPALVDFSKEDSSLIITGRVDDVRPYIESAAAYIVPLRIGGGTRLKIFEAMAMEKPVVSTTVGAEGLPLTDGVELLLADEPQTFAEAVVKLFE